MLVDARVIGDPDRVFAVGQEIEGADAELQVGLGHAEPIGEMEAPAAEGEVLATQAALDHAEALGVDIVTIKGSGKDGKVTKGDVEAAVAEREAR